MARSNTFGDRLALFAAANWVNVHVISILGLGASHTFQPISSNAMGTVYLDHFAENHGDTMSVWQHGPTAMQVVHQLTWPTVKV